MEIRYKLYPYPVLSYYSDDYIDSHFDVIIDAKRDGYNIKLNFIAEVKNDELQHLIVSEKAKIVYHLECAQTGFRVALQTTDCEYTYLVSDKDVCGTLQICPFIVALKDIPSYVSQSFHTDYRGFKFDIEAGCVMAVGKQVDFNIEKSLRDMCNTPSVFSIVKNADETVIGMIVDIEKNKIVIKLPDADYYNFNSIKDVPDIQPVLNALVVIPALTYALEELSKRDSTERDEYSRYGWYRVIKKVLFSKFNCDVESDTFSTLNMLELAQKLINSPLTDGLKVLSSSYSNIEVGDEE